MIHRCASIGSTITLFLLAAPACTAPFQEPNSAFFEQKIHPILARHCYSCHSAEAKKLKGGLRLDTRAGVLRGGESGPVIVPGHPEKSLLLQALRYESLQMPPKGKLPAAVVADFEAWIRRGAPDPRRDSPATGSKAMDFAAARKHWAYQPMRAPQPPAVRNSEWPATPIDRYILAKLEAADLTPSPPADRRTLIRRVYYDLIGLPPTLAEIEVFAKDRRPDAWARVVDRLLASPQYGERWGRHWLDVARYADTKDLVLLFGKDRLRPYAYTYRDYVIRALNEDTPYDRFIHEQLAADQIEPKVESWRLAALGFLTLGRLFDNNLPDIYDDQIDTVTRGLLGLTVACARCHDHKYDAIPTADYYALYGVFASSEVPIDLPLIQSPETIPGGKEFEKKLAQKRLDLQRHIDKQYEMLTETARTRVTDYLVRIATQKPDPLENAVFFLSLSPDDLRPAIVSRWRRFIAARPADDPVFGPWKELVSSDSQADAHEIRSRWTAKAPGMAPGTIHPLIREALLALHSTTPGDVARAYGAVFQQVYAESKKHTSALGSAERELLAMLTEPGGPVFFPRRSTYLYMSRVERDTYGRSLLELDKLAVNSPGAPPRAMVLNDSPQIYNPRIFVRGSPSRPGEPVTRHFPRILAGDDPRPFPHGSGRLDLARAITAPDNPLTSRVIVNRIWMEHFDEPLVSTPSDFGTRSTPPTHPELLDYLAWTLQHNGWSLKQLHRQIVMSRVYQQASADRPECRAKDPDNRLLGRGRRRRLDFEAMRDTLLALSGRLDNRLGGHAVDVAADALNRRRTVYAIVDRQDLPALFRAFDFPVPDQSVERRSETTVPQQALFGLNAPFVLEQVRALVKRPEIAAESNPRRRIAALYRLILARDPAIEETEAALRFIQRQGQPTERSQLTEWEQLAQVLLLTNELMFVD